MCFANEAYAAIGCDSVDPSYIARRLITQPGGYGMPGLPPEGSCLPAAIEYVTEQAAQRGTRVPMLAAVRASSAARLDTVAAARCSRETSGGS